MIIDCISDLHGYYPKLEGGDLLIVGGDLTASDDHKHINQFKDWVIGLDYSKIVIIAGNHDNWIQERFLINGDKPSWNHSSLTYLEDCGTEFEALKIWGSPWTLTFEGMNPHCKAFTVDTEGELAEKWALIPDNVDILVTHCPPYGMLDQVMRENYEHGIAWDEFESTGSHSLGLKIAKINPKLVVFGHIHEHGAKTIQGKGGCILVNASHVNERYEPVNKPVRVIL